MHRSFDDEIFLSPESIIFGLLATAADADEPELPEVDPAPQSWTGAAADPDAEADDADTDESIRIREDADPIDVWSRRARRASGFGG